MKLVARWVPVAASELRIFPGTGPSWSFVSGAPLALNVVFRRLRVEACQDGRGVMEKVTGGRIADSLLPL
jgi:hypothetical protein